MPEEKKTYYSEANKKASERYKAKNIKRVPLDVQKEQFLQIQAAAAAAGQSVNGYIKEAIMQRMERDAQKGPEQA